MPAEAGVYVRGLRELSTAFSAIGGEARREFRSEFREIAEPVRRTAESLAPARISHIGKPWSKMRVGQTRTLVYVAPKQRGRKRHAAVTPARRAADRAFAGRLMDEAMEPALARNEPRIEHDVEHVLDHITEQFNRGGI